MKNNPHKSFRSWDAALRDLSAICASCSGFGFASAADECACLDCPVIYRDVEKRWVIGCVNSVNF